MLIKLGTYLRILGYDADWSTRIRTHELIVRANRERRVFITRNRRLAHAYPAADSLLVVPHDDPVAQLRAVVTSFDMDSHRWLFSRCIRCNVRLEAVPDKVGIRASVHPNVYDAYDEFYRCPNCGTVFWKGSHVRNTSRKLGLVCDESEGTG